MISDKPERTHTQYMSCLHTKPSEHTKSESSRYSVFHSDLTSLYNETERSASTKRARSLT